MENINTDTNNENFKEKGVSGSEEVQKQVASGDINEEVQGNSDVEFGAEQDESDVEINTGDLGEKQEADFDRSSHPERKAETESGGDKDFQVGSSFKPEGYDKSGPEKSSHVGV